MSPNRWAACIGTPAINGCVLHRIVAMLTRMAMKFDGVAESSTEYHAAVDYDYEHRFAEHEHEHEHEHEIENTPEPWDATERRW